MRKFGGPLLSRLARDAAGFISPSELRMSGDLDFRRAIKIKKVLHPGVELPQAGSSAVDGVVCHKNVAHKRMRTLIQNPRIVTLSGALEQDPAQDKLSSIDALMDTERQRLRNWVEGLTEVGPDVVLVEGGAASHAQELLLEAGISLATGVKPELLRRVARCVGSTVKPVGAALTLACVGSCQVFEVFQPQSTENGEEEASEPTPVMFFKGCARGLGASIVLQGNSLDELKRVKEVAINACFASLWNSIEAAFLADQFVAAAALLPDLASSNGARAQVLARESALHALETRGNGLITSASPHCSVFGGNAELKLEENTSAATSLDFECTQELWLSISCKNPAKGIQCEAPHLHAMPYYREGDLPLADFLAAAAPTNRKCPHPQCGDGAALHLRSFFHGDSLVTLSSVHLPADKELLGAEKRTVWYWMRPMGRARDAAIGQAVQRISLSLDAARISFSHLLTLLLDSRHLSVSGASFQHDFVRYLGLGRTVICLHHSVIKPFAIQLPSNHLSVSEDSTARWLVEEVKALTEETDEILDSLQKIVALYRSGTQATLAEDCLSTLAEVKTTLMTTVRSIPTEGPFDSVDLITRPVQLVNKLRRHLAMLVQRWDSAFLQSGNTAAAKAGQISDAQNQTYIAHSRSSSAASSVHAFQSLPPVNGQKPVPNMPTQSFMAPKLIEVTDPGAQTLPKEPVLIDEAIPTGLVARYVSHFEEQEQLNLARANSNPDIGSSAKRQWGPSTTIDLRGVNIDMELRRATTADDEIDADFENRLERLVDSLSELATGQLVETLEEGTPPPRIIPLQSFLTGRPLLPNEADGSQPPVTVYDKEPTSIVAFFLSSKQYKTYAEQAKDSCLDESHSEESVETRLKVDAGLSVEERVLQASLQLDCQMIAEDKSASGTARFQMTAYYAPHFAALRQLCISGGESAYLASIGRCVPWSAQGGKSNVFFAKSMDDRYVIKQLTKSEKQSVLEYAPEYFKYVGASGGEGQGGKSCLAKIIGIYQVQIEYFSARAPSFGKEGLMDFIIMENLFHGCEVQSIYDLKGSERDRYANETESRNGGPTVLLDDNLRELIRTSPTLVTPAAFLTLQQSLCDDTNFLASLGVMDYSLLVGFNRIQQKLVIGLVDYVRQYTWDKQVESWVKKSGLLGGAGKEPTIISPQQYARRFRAAMLSYFTVVPCLTKPPNNICSDIG
ncbi:hypothetical protein Ndes2437A_g03576 [Nannochloris sp. 'desiccata']